MPYKYDNLCDIISSRAVSEVEGRGCIEIMHRLNLTADFIKLEFT